MTLTLRCYGVLELEDSWDPLVVPLGNVWDVWGTSEATGATWVEIAEKMRSEIYGWLTGGAMNYKDEEEIEIITTTKVSVNDYGRIALAEQGTGTGFLKIRMEHDDEWTPVQWQAFYESLLFRRMLTK